MANKNKKTQPIRTTPTGFKTRNGANNNIIPEAPEKKKLSSEKKKRILIAVIAAVAGVAIIAGIVLAVLFGIGVLGGEDEFDYHGIDLSKYISFKDDYKKIDLSMPLEEYTEARLTSAINELLVRHKNKTPLFDGLDTRNQAITIGDVVKIRFRGYTLDENGREVELDGGSNLTEEKPDTLEIGSATFTLGFEESLIGKIPENYPRFEKIKTGTVEAGDVVYFSYTSYSQQTAGSVKSMRIDLSSDDVDEKYGIGFKDYLIGKSVGALGESKTFTLSAGGSVGYADMTVDFITRCESAPLTITVSFPENYAEENLRGKDVYYDVYIDTCVVYDTPEYNETFIKDTLYYTAESLAEYQGATLVEKHKAMLKAKIEGEIKDANEYMLKEEFWAHVLDMAEIKEYPKEEYDYYYNTYYREVEDYYLEYQQTYGFESLEDAAIKYYKLEQGANWQSYIKLLAENEVKEKLIFFYIIKEEGLEPTEAEIVAESKDQIQLELDYQIETRPNDFIGLSATEYAEKVATTKKAIEDWFGEDMLRELAYYNCGMVNIVNFIRNS